MRSFVCVLSGVSRICVSSSFSVSSCPGAYVSPSLMALLWLPVLYNRQCILPEWQMHSINVSLSCVTVYCSSIYVHHSPKLSGWMGSVDAQLFSGFSRDVRSGISQNSGWAELIQRLVLKPLLRCVGCVLRVIVLLEVEPSPQSEVLSALEQVSIKDLHHRSSFPRS